MASGRNAGYANKKGGVIFFFHFSGKGQGNYHRGGNVGRRRDGVRGEGVRGDCDPGQRLEWRSGDWGGHAGAELSGRRLEFTRQVSGPQKPGGPHPPEAWRWGAGRIP